MDTAVNANAATILRRQFLRILPKLVLLVCACSEGVARSEGQEAGYSPEKVKAAFLYHFGAYVEWPTQALPTDAFTIAVLGAQPIAEELERIAPQRRIQGRPLQVQEIRSIEELGAAQILFVRPGRGQRLSRLIEPLRGRSLLIVTDAEEGLRHGAAIKLTIADQRVRFEVSRAHAQRENLYLSSRLLDIALRVE
jgi:hypothetical protein